MKKKTLSLALALALCLGLTVSAFAVESDFIIRDGILSGYTGAGGDVAIPDGVAEIEAATFLEYTNVTSVTFPDSMNYIGPGAFAYCTGLTSVVLPEGVTSAGNGAFSGCTNLTSVTIPASMTTIVDSMFFGCTGLKDIYYGGSEEQWKAVTIDEGNDPLKSATIHYNSGTQPTIPTQPEQPAGTKTANPTNDKLEVNGAEKAPTVYKIDGSNYFQIRDVAAVLNGTEKQFAVGYSGGKVTLTSGQPYEATGKELAGAPAADEAASPSNDTVIIDGAEANLTVYKIGGSNYFKLRDLGEALNFYVGWEAGRGVYIETDKPYSK